VPLRVSSPVLVGRADELKWLSAALAEARDGRPAVALVAGEAGVGKTRLVEELIREAGDSGARVLVGGCVELGGEGFPFAPVVDALRTLVADLPPQQLDEVLGSARDDLSRLLPELSTAAARPESAGEFGRSRMFELLLAVFTRVAADRPLVLVIEDLHWADRSTLDLVVFFARSLRNTPVLLVLSYRSDEVDRRHPLRPVLALLERMRQVVRVQLDRFDRPAVAEQLAGILGHEADGPLVTEVFTWSEGNPFLVEEVLELREKGSMASSLSNVLLDRVERLSDSGRRVVRVAAAGGHRVQHLLVAEVADMPEDELAAGLREAVENHVMTVDHNGRGYAFRHVLTREAVYDDMLPGELVPLHRAYAAALSANPSLAAGFPAAGEAYHWFAAHDLPRALPAAVLAARQAASAFAFSEAEQHARRALEIWPTIPEPEQQAAITHVELLELASLATSAAGDDSRADAYLEQALEEIDRGAAPATAAVLMARRAMLQFQAGRADPLPQLQAALALLPEGEPTRERAVVLAALARCVMLTTPTAEADGVGPQAVAAARAAGCEREEASSLTSLGTSLTYRGEIEAGISSLREALAIARRIGDVEEASRAYINLSDSLAAVGRHEEALATSVEGLTFSERAGLARSRGAFQAGNLADSLIRLGRWAEARERCDETLMLDPVGLAGANLHCALAELAAFQGRPSEFQAELATVRRVAGTDAGEQYEMPLAYVEAVVARDAGDLETAATLVDRSLSGDEAVEFPRYGWPLAWLRARLARERGLLPPPLSALGSLAVAAPADAAYRAMVEAEAADGEDGVRAWGFAVERWRLAGEPFPLAQSLLRLGVGLVEAQDRDAAADALAEAGTIGARLGAAPLVAEVESLARRARLPRRTASAGAGAGPELDARLPALTHREVDVLRLVAEGQSNSQIAAALYISPKTVSVHVTNVLAKLGVANRREAAAVAYRAGLLESQ
jgi:DNA-binding CsgD family transcriptional regulator/tetratricopeptide (TPR) repeat protein